MLESSAYNFSLYTAEIGVSGDVKGGAVVAPGAIGGLLASTDVANQFASRVDDHDATHAGYPEIAGLVGLDSVGIAWTVFAVGGCIEEQLSFWRLSCAVIVQGIGHNDRFIGVGLGDEQGSFIVGEIDAVGEGEFIGNKRNLTIAI